jgi:hypothetical protein
MTCDKSIIRIFRQNRSFWHSLVVWEGHIATLDSSVATLKRTCSLWDFFVVCPILNLVMVYK